MSLKRFLSDFDFSLTKEELKDLNLKVKDFLKELKEGLKKDKVNAQVFIGGSYAKGTLLKGDGYDIDIFVRFSKNEEKISEVIEKCILNNISKEKYEIKKIHGSRDYFRIAKKEDRNKIYFEIIPVLKISNPEKSQNVTDLSYFHVKYVNKKLDKKDVRKDIGLMKKFCKASGVYGAESYIRGISGYGVECLVIHCGGFEKTCEYIKSVKKGDIIDSEKLYKNKNEVLVEMNESRLESPIILVDPTWKERNVLAALSEDSLNKLKSDITKFLKKPAKDMFEVKKIDEKKLVEIAHKERADFLKVKIETNKQEGDIAGTKLKKFYSHFLSEIENEFEIIKNEFEYTEGSLATIYFIAKPLKEIIVEGPPKDMVQSAKNFKKVNRKPYLEKGRWYARKKTSKNLSEFTDNWKKKNRRVIREMSITSMEE